MLLRLVLVLRCSKQLNGAIAFSQGTECSCATQVMLYADAEPHLQVPLGVMQYSAPSTSWLGLNTMGLNTETSMVRLFKTPPGRHAA